MRIIPKGISEWMMILIHALEAYILALPVITIFVRILNLGHLIAYPASAITLIVLGILVVRKNKEVAVTAFLVALIGAISFGVLLLPSAMSSHHP